MSSLSPPWETAAPAGPAGRGPAPERGGQDPDATAGAAIGWDASSEPDVRVNGQIPATPVPPGVAYEVASAGEDLLLLSYQPDGTAIGSWFPRMWPGEWSEPVAIPLPPVKWMYGTQP